jgi:hypothetical protein
MRLALNLTNHITPSHAAEAASGAWRAEESLFDL